MKGFRREILRVFITVPLIAFLIFTISLMKAWGAGFVVAHPVPIEKGAASRTSSSNIWYAISTLLAILGFAGYLQKKDSRK